MHPHQQNNQSEKTQPDIRADKEKENKFKQDDERKMQSGHRDDRQKSDDSDR